MIFFGFPGDFHGIYQRMGIFMGITLWCHRRWQLNMFHLVRCFYQLQTFMYTVYGLFNYCRVLEYFKVVANFSETLTHIQIGQTIFDSHLDTGNVDAYILVYTLYILYTYMQDVQPYDNDVYNIYIYTYILIESCIYIYNVIYLSLHIYIYRLATNRSI